jgi:alkylation response protein AidB-like acyl-CoA dehydrogenase
VQRDHFTDEHDMFREAFRTFLDREMVPHREAWTEAEIVDRDVFAKAGASGFLAMAVPEQYGGAGVDDFRYSQVIVEELTRADLYPHGLGITLHNDVCLPYFLDYTTDEQKQRWLPGIASGELITAVAMTEPGIGSDLASMTTTAIRDGDTYVLNGSKTFITNGINADLVMVACKTDPTQKHKGMSIARRRAGHGGLRAGPQPGQGRDARPGHRRAVLHRRPRPGGQPASATRARASCTWSRTCPRSGCRSRRPRWRTAGRRSTWTIDYAKERTAFGQPIGVLPEQPLQAGRDGDRGRRSPKRSSTAASSCSTTAASPPRRRPWPSGGPPSCRSGWPTPACSCTAATAT